MASEIDICNLALSLLGERAEVTSITPPDGTNEAQQCGRFYPMARDELLEMFAWSFATRRVVLASVDSDRPGWLYAYTLPTTCLKPLSVLAQQVLDDTESADFIVETSDTGTRLLFTNQEEATLRYVATVTDTTRFTPLFCAALARLMSVKLAGQMIKGTTGMQISQGMEKIFIVERAEAITSDANSGSSGNAYRNRIPDLVVARGMSGPLDYTRGRYGR